MCDVVAILLFLQSILKSFLGVVWHFMDSVWWICGTDCFCNSHTSVH